MGLAVCLLIYAGILTLSTIIAIGASSAMGKAFAVAIINGFGVVVMILAAFRLMPGS